MEALSVKLLFKPDFVVSGVFEVRLVYMPVKNDIHKQFLLNGLYIHICRLNGTVFLNGQNADLAVVLENGCLYLR